MLWPKRKTRMVSSPLPKKSSATILSQIPRALSWTRTSRNQVGRKRRRSDLRPSAKSGKRRNAKRLKRMAQSPWNSPEMTTAPVLKEYLLLPGHRLPALRTVRRLTHCASTGDVASFASLPFSSASVTSLRHHGRAPSFNRALSLVWI